MLDASNAPKSTTMTHSIATPEALLDFVRDQLQLHPNIDQPAQLTLLPLSGDAGFRQYFRVNTSPSLLAVNAPRDADLSESAEHFTQLSQKLIAQGVASPQVLALDAERNLMLIEDLGDDLLLDQLNADSAGLLYGEALMALSRLQQIPRHCIDVPDYNAAELQEEMSFFSYWFVEQMLDHSATEKQTQTIRDTFNFLTEQALAQPQTLVHRDYHSRNLIYREGEALGVIDFQDALWGPISYDVVSLLRDCYIRWPEAQVEQWLMGYGDMLVQLGVMPMVSRSQWQRWFDFMGLQRHIKVLGVFARLFLRDNKTGYLKDLPLVLRYTIEVAEKYDETRPFAELLKQDLLPTIEQQHWYRDYRNAGNE